MGRIDKATVDKIHDATNIVDVVSDFVSLKRRGSSYLGLCPFHNERTPSFSVSASRGIFKCFSCGKAGSAISFLMDLENMTYVEALKWLGRKYNIEVKEQEQTSEERLAEAERESMMAVNEFALGVFASNLTDNEEGRAVGMSYFRERGISDAMISKFKLGYAIDRPDDLLARAKAAGFSEKYLEQTGLAARSDRGLYDRFKGRVIYPILGLSGRAVAFGGRTLRADKSKNIAKYVNSPESIVYSKSNELYGMYQARNAIARKKHCILVEGYMDVISMHQAGVENVVASSGTSLTEGQIKLIRRFADTVTLIYDSDAAGLKAALRGIDMLVAAGLALKIVKLPDGDDPDSFAQSHSSSEVEEYIENNSRNLIDFKTDLLLSEAGNDPRKRGEAINDILQTIALIPDIVEQSLYIDEFSKKSGVAAATLAAQLKKFIALNAEKRHDRRLRDEALASLDRSTEQTVDEGTRVGQPVEQSTEGADALSPSLVMAEEELIKDVIRRGLLYLCDIFPDEKATQPVPMSVMDYVECEMRVDDISFRVPLHERLWQIAKDIRDKNYPAERAAKEAELELVREEARREGLEQIRQSAVDHIEIGKLESALEERIAREFDEAFDEFSAGFIRSHMLRHEDREIIDAVARMTADPVVLSRMYPKEDGRALALRQLPVAINTLKSTILKDEMSRILQELAKPHTDAEFMELQKRYLQKKELSMALDKFTGEIVVTPRVK